MGWAGVDGRRPGMFRRGGRSENGYAVVGRVRHGGGMRYFTSDTHYGHQNIIRFCERPYVDVHHMNVDLVNRAAGMVNVGDEVWHLGDVALGYLDSTLTNLARIAVDVTLVAGNHDRCHPSNGARGERFVEVYRERCRLSELILTNTTLTLSNGVGVDSWGGNPVGEDAIIELIEAGPRDLPPLPWDVGGHV